jgi:hypothetical protein
VLIPAAMEGVLNSANAWKVRAGVIAEAANLPTTPDADRVFRTAISNTCRLQSSGLTAAAGPEVEDIRRNRRFRRCPTFLSEDQHAKTDLYHKARHA